MLRFSANLGFLWQELDLCQAIRAAAGAGFDAVECHWPYETPATHVVAALKDTGLPMLGLNTRIGDRAAGDFGLAAVPGRKAEARAYIDEAVAYAGLIKCRNIHVMAGRTNSSEEAESVYRENLFYACNQAEEHGVTILIEPINNLDVQGYHLTTIEAAIETIASVGQPNLKIMFDCYHTQIMQGDLLTHLTANLGQIGHIQIAAVPDRGEPDSGEVNYKDLLSALDAAGYTGFVGAEYRPRATTDEGLGWLNSYK